MGRGAAAPDTAPAAQGAAVPLAEADALGRRIEASLNAGDPSVFTAALDFGAVVDTALAGLSAPADFRAGMMAGSLKNNPAPILAAESKEGATVRFLRSRQVGGQSRILLRFIGKRGMNYLELYVAPGLHGVRVVDVETYAAGETVSQSLRRMALPMIAELNRGRLATLLGGKSEYLENLPHIQAMQRMFTSGDAAGVLREYDALPPTLRGEKSIMLVRTLAALRVSREVYHKVLDEYLAAFPNDPSALIMSLDALFAKGKYPELLAAIDRLDATVGGDPSLNVMRAAAARKQNDPATAKVVLDKAIAAEPGLRQAYFVRIDLALADRDFAGTARLLTAAERNARVQWSDLLTVPVYAEFVKSPEYAKWSRQHAAGPATVPATRPSPRADQ